MIYQHSAQPYIHSTVHIGTRRPMDRSGGLDLPYGLQLWKAVGKVMLVLLPLVVCCQLIIGAMISRIEESINTTDDLRYNLTITNSLLKAERSRLLKPEQITSIVGGKLSLQKPEKGQVRVYNRASGQFSYL